MIEVEAFPLQWPTGTPRTLATARQRAKFSTSFDQARRGLELELSRLGVRYGDYVISSNVPLRLDGQPYATAARQTYADPGVAVYFDFGTGVKAIACDRWTLVQDNLQAIRKTIEALRGLDRWGATTMEQAFSGYALPETIVDGWWTVLGVDKGAEWEEVEEAYRAKVRVYHPDRGGNVEMFHVVQEAYKTASREFHARSLMR